MPTVAHDEKATAIRYETMCDVYDGIMPVKKVGQTHIWFTPWDFLLLRLRPARRVNHLTVEKRKTVRLFGCRQPGRGLLPRL